jgi:hypothetical protein
MAFRRARLCHRLSEAACLAITASTKGLDLYLFPNNARPVQRRNRRLLIDAS